MKVEVKGKEHMSFSTGVASRVEVVKGTDGGWTICAYEGEGNDLDQEPSLMLETAFDEGTFVTEEPETFMVETRRMRENLSEEEQTHLLALIEKSKRGR